MMKLFPIKQAMIQEQQVVHPQIHTPLGIIQVSFSLSGESIQPERSYILENGTTVYIYSHTDLHCELVVCPIMPQLPVSMNVEACWAAIFRMQPKLNTVVSDCTFAACWQEGHTWTSYGSDTGQYLEAAEYSNAAYRLHLGTEDQEMLMIRRDQGDRIPVSFGESSDMEWDKQIRLSERGLQVPMSTVEDGELCQIHFVVAWNKKIEEDVSTWFAVDQTAGCILKLANLQV